MLLWRTTQLPFRFRPATRTQVAGSTVSSGNINLEEVIQVLLTCCLSIRRRLSRRLGPTLKRDKGRETMLLLGRLSPGDWEAEFSAG
jgi:hypothetical protein